MYAKLFAKIVIFRSEMTHFGGFMLLLTIIFGMNSSRKFLWIKPTVCNFAAYFYYTLFISLLHKL